MKSVISTKALTKRYGGMLANSNVDFELPEGQITALIGPNGAGKTTFVGMLSGRIEATSGEVHFNGQDISHMPAHKRIRLGMAYTFQITSIFSGLTLYENVALAARPRMKNPKDEVALKSKVKSALQRVELYGRAMQIASDLSYGHQRLLEIAMGLAQDPVLFILDEPTQGLAESEVSAFIELIKSLAGETTILLIEHNMDVVMKSADNITVLNFGEILASGTPEEIKNNPDVQAAYLGTTEDA